MVAEAIESVQKSLSDVMTVSGPLRMKVDWRDESPGFKFSHWEVRGVPFRLEIGPRDVAAGNGVLVRRVDRDKQTVALSALAAELPTRLADYQAMLLQRALDFRAANTHNAETYDEFKQVMEGRPGYVVVPWAWDAANEAQVKAETQATIRNVPFSTPKPEGKKCMFSGKPADVYAYFAKAY